MLLALSTRTQAQTQIDFVTPSIVRVRWSPNGELPGNATRTSGTKLWFKVKGSWLNST